MIISVCWWLNTKGYIKIEFCGFGMSDLRFTQKFNEYWFTNGSVSVLSIPICCLRWLFKTRNKERIIRGDKPF